MYLHVHDFIRDVERKKERHLRQWKNENESCLKWDSNPRHSVLRTDALPTELPSYSHYIVKGPCMQIS